jgi:hypothetical protein
VTDAQAHIRVNGSVLSVEIGRLVRVDVGVGQPRDSSGHQATAIDFIATSARLRFGHSLDSEPIMVNRGCVSRATR